MFRRQLIASVITCTFIGSSLAQETKTLPQEGTEATPKRMSSAAEEAAKYEYWCGKPLPLRPCIDEIIRVAKEIDEREEAVRKGEIIGYNAGNSLVGCSIYCLYRHFPHDTPRGCKASIAKYKKAVARKPDLGRTGLPERLRERCAVPF